MSWINLTAIWKIVGFGLLAGAGLPAIFALGLLALSRGGRAQTARAAGAGGADSEVLVGSNPAGLAAAAFCFLIAAAAIGWGIYEVYKIGHPAAK